jgi:hypothetical protein
MEIACVLKEKLEKHAANNAQLSQLVPASTSWA